jgi:hypothetical protein
MKISYSLQLKDFCILFLIGFIIGIIYGIINIHKTIKKIYILQIIGDIIFCLTAIIALLASINHINHGEFRLFLIIGYTLGFILERITLGKLFAKGYKCVYTKLINLTRKFVNSKLGKVLFK